MAVEVRLAGEGVLRRAGDGYAGTLDVLGVALELVGQVAEDEGGRHFRISAYYRCGLPDHLYVPLLDDPAAIEDRPPAPREG